jgi:hypothetical protein
MKNNLNQQPKSIRYELQLFDSKHEKTFETVFCLEETDDYTKILNQIANTLKDHCIDIYLEELAVFVIGGRMEREKFIVVKKVE